MRNGTNTAIRKTGITPRVVTDNTTQVSVIVDRLGWESVESHLATGSLADSDVVWTTLIEDGNNATLTDAAPVADEFLVSQTTGVAPELAASGGPADDGEVRRIEYIGPKRYVRHSVLLANNTGTFFIGQYWYLRAPHDATVAQPVS